MQIAGTMTERRTKRQWDRKRENITDWHDNLKNNIQRRRWFWNCVFWPQRDHTCWCSSLLKLRANWNWLSSSRSSVAGVCWTGCVVEDRGWSAKTFWDVPKDNKMVLLVKPSLPRPVGMSPYWTKRRDVDVSETKGWSCIWLATGESVLLLRRWAEEWVNAVHAQRFGLWTEMRV